ncbi:uncharacterized protein EKO05_0011124 [Ascochyta rabiei]|uniref:Phosphoric diester hydrolase n=1 Tax=Didymella rabiei TaxID=5454 RepID=A0A163A6L0_DIDRA|nr:uncharacterized protein EKO05_0011124 [Ascochyta rabiei]KZM21013.1 phosphoric diester hydrolase [Ascochyta rabiei]UPX20912.1 hypothetical protein EKO05_0011124 [Ascochyta rabiei]
MTPSTGSCIPPAKRRKLDDKAAGELESATTSGSLHRPVSPPVSRRKTPVPNSASQLAPTPTWKFGDVPKQTLPLPPSQSPPQGKHVHQTDVSAGGVLEDGKHDGVAESNVEYIASPFKLTKIRDLAAHQNVDTVELKDILGDPLIKECWNFNFLFDIDFLMQQSDEDIRDIVKIKIVHGFWKRDDERRINLMETSERHPNIELINAYLPDPFGTHHSKMLVLFRHDDCAQIVVHTANMIPKDWTNMTQAVWRSPILLPSTATATAVPSGPHAIGSGHRFQVDLLRYLGNYEKRLRRLSDQLVVYDFSSIKAAFLGSTPSRQVVSKTNPTQQTSFGWLGLQEILSNVPITAQKNLTTSPHIVLQVSSIATLGGAPTWLSHFQSVLARSHSPRQILPRTKPRFNIIFPTPEEVRTSLDGYESGGSIHTKVQSAQQQKQLQYLHPLLCHWKHPASHTSSSAAASTRREAHRGSAAPHIKTYIRFSDTAHKTINWALLTSANLSKQAWGDVTNKQGEVRIQSYETGVLVWPALFAEPGRGSCMVPMFGSLLPGVTHSLEVDDGDGDVDEEVDDAETEDETIDDEETEDEDVASHTQSQSKLDKGKAPMQDRNTGKRRIVVGLQMPYDLPLSPYSVTDQPWCATQSYRDPDWKGRTWGGW